MEATGFADLEQAHRVLGGLLTGARNLRDGAFWKIRGDELLDVGRSLEQLSRMVYAAQIRFTDEVDAQNMALTRGCTSTGALLVQALNIGPGDAFARVAAARHTRPQDLPSGGETPAVLPELGAALDAGEVGPEHVRTIIATMRRLPHKLHAQTRDWCETTLVGHAITSNPKTLAQVAQLLENSIDPDGKFDDRDPASRAEFTIGTRNPSTGLTPISGRLDDQGVAIVGKAIGGLAAPLPEVDGIKDLRPAANRRAHALLDALRGYLAAGDGPEHGGHKPTVVITLSYDNLTKELGAAMLDTGATLTAAQTRQALCDAKIIPAVLGGDGEILDVGRASRTFPRAIRRAIEIRDRGCTWPGCDRPRGWCDAHHVAWWNKDLGPSSYTNGVLLCTFHHTEIHKGEWQLRMTDNGHPEFTTPRWLDPHQRPRHNTLHHPQPNHPQRQ